MKVTFGALCGVVALLGACGEREANVAMAEVCRYYQAERWSLSYGVTSSSPGGIEKTILLKLEEIPHFDFFTEKGSITSAVALKYVGLAEPSELEGFARIDVDASFDKIHERGAFSIKDLQLVDSLLQVVTSFFALCQERRYDDLTALNDDDYLPDSTLNKIVGELIRLDSVEGPLHDPGIIGFSIGRIEEKDLALVVYRTVVPFGPQASANLEFQVNRANGLLSFVGVHAF